MNQRALPPDSGSKSAGLLLWIAPLFGGVIHALSFASDPLPAPLLPFAQLLGLAILAYCTFRARSVRNAFIAGLSFGLTWFCVGLYWLYISMHVYGAMVAPLAAGGVFALSLYLSIYPALACALTKRLGGATSLHAARPGAVLFFVLTWAAAWSVTEWLRGVVFTGFPWLNVGYAHVDSPFVGWAPLVGIYGVAFWVAFAAGALALCVKSASTALTSGPAAVTTGLQKQTTPTSTPLLETGPAVRRACVPVWALAVVSALLGTGLSYINWSVPHGQPLQVQLLQGNIPQSQKFDPALMERGIVSQLALAGRDHPGAPPPDLVLLPETVLPVFQNQISSNVWRAWRDIAALRDTTLIMGAPLNTAANGTQRYTNSVIAIDADTSIEALQSGDLDWRYDKQHLVPFGEFVPLGFRWFVNAMQIPLGDFDRGPVRQTPYDIADQRIAMNICYEDLFGEELLPALHGDTHGPGATILANVSNLGWFGDSWALRQHLQIARLRTIETARPMLASTNTGITAAIDHTGRVNASIPSHQPGVLAVSVQGMTGLTPYARVGNILILGLTLLILVAAGVRHWQGRRTH